MTNRARPPRPRPARPRPTRPARPRLLRPRRRIPPVLDYSGLCHQDLVFVDHILATWNDDTTVQVGGGGWGYYGSDKNLFMMGATSYQQWRQQYGLGSLVAPCY